MTEQTDQQTIPVKRQPVAPAKQLATAVEQRMLRDPHDRVKCIHLFDDYFRCNWWAPPSESNKHLSFAWGISATHHVRKSRFLKVTRVNEKLMIEEMK